MPSLYEKKKIGKPKKAAANYTLLQTSFFCLRKSKTIITIGRKQQCSALEGRWFGDLTARWQFVRVGLHERLDIVPTLHTGNDSSASRREAERHF